MPLLLPSRDELLRIHDRLKAKVLVGCRCIQTELMKGLMRLTERIGMVGKEHGRGEMPALIHVCMQRTFRNTTSRQADRPQLSILTTTKETTPVDLSKPCGLCV